MSRLKELLKEENFEKDIDELLSSRVITSPVCGLMRPRLTSCNEKENAITIEFPVLKEQLNEHGTMHAGLIATAFDEALGIFAAYLSNGKPTVSINISVNYLKPVPMDDSMLITAKATSLGRKLITISGECHLKSNGLLTDTALATFAIVR